MKRSLSKDPDQTEKKVKIAEEEEFRNDWQRKYKGIADAEAYKKLTETDKRDHEYHMITTIMNTGMRERLNGAECSPHHEFIRELIKNSESNVFVPKVDWKVEFEGLLACRGDLYQLVLVPDDYDVDKLIELLGTFQFLVIQCSREVKKVIKKFILNGDQKVVVYVKSSNDIPPELNLATGSIECPPE